MHIDTPEKGIEKLNTDDDIVVCCSNTTCAASMYAYKLLEENGYQYVRRYAGGIQDWEEAGYSLEGEMVNKDWSQRFFTNIDRLQINNPWWLQYEWTFEVFVYEIANWLVDGEEFGLERIGGLKVVNKKKTKH